MHGTASLANGHEPVCLVPDGAFSPACVLLEFTRAPAHILRVSNSTDIGTSTPTLNYMGHGCFVLELVAGSFLTQLAIDHFQRTF